MLSNTIPCYKACSVDLVISDIELYRQPHGICYDNSAALIL